MTCEGMYCRRSSTFYDSNAAAQESIAAPEKGHPKQASVTANIYMFREEYETGTQKHTSRLFG